ncbi:MAG TPA: nucleoside phosphorylase [Clostridia bacterium]|jgi:uridine phosphorylase|nr:nucleoside phosphorylase [Clostridia bacterium]
MSEILNKSEITKGQKQYHIALSPGEIGEYVLLPGDPARSDIVATYLDDAKLMANNREHRTFTGYYKGVKVSVTSTGMGCPSAAIAAEELINIGAKALIRIGSSAALDPNIRIGDLMISRAAMKNEGTSRFYVPDAFPAVPDLELTWALIETAREMCKPTGEAVYVGINSSDDAFYGETPEFLDQLRKYKIMNIEMESSALYTIGHLRGVRTACICGTSGNLTNQEVIYTEKNVKLAEAWEREIRIVLETIYRFEQRKNA